MRLISKNFKKESGKGDFENFTKTNFQNFKILEISIKKPLFCYFEKLKVLINLLNIKTILKKERSSF